jgi:hypothetical protein
LGWIGEGFSDRIIVGLAIEETLDGYLFED